MKKIKLFEEFNTNENVLKTDVPRIQSFVAKLIAKVKDAKLVKDIKNFVSMHEIDPYPYTFETFIKDIKDHFSGDIDFSGITESILLEEHEIFTFDRFINESYSPVSSSLFASIAKKVAKSLDPKVEYTVADIAKKIANSGVAAMHSKDNAKVIEVLKKLGFLVDPIKKGDEVIENPDMEGFGFKGQTGVVQHVKLNVGGDKNWTSYQVKFGKDSQEYHNNEIIKK